MTIDNSEAGAGRRPRARAGILGALLIAFARPWDRGIGAAGDRKQRGAR
ncbi:hypothetical protein [Actinoplanes siamensis]|uniref:Uncharacterized protein n=1 Tax=Actinoplanes siamensis TaxID=1223317 RepID=A0A919TKE1_9ACTN|nr:hypothetical protein [Actinoplanes siamensis]GIF05065.1 hypothetical protein Asi03nite_26030 [Actinoplanes siamensis]